MRRNLGDQSNGGAIAIAARAALVALVTFVGCEERRPASAMMPLDNPATKPSRPTTQELIHGAHVRQPLKSMPFSMATPKGWNTRSIAGVLVLEGPTPAGVAQIRIARRPSPIAQHADRLIEGSKRDAAARPGPYTLAEVRELSSFRVLETRSAEARRSDPAVDSAGNVIAPTSTPLNWKLNVFVPSGRDTDVCELQFIDLTVEQYEIDKELLHKMVASLEYDVNASSN